MAGYPAQMPGLEGLVNTFGVYNPETYDKARQTFDLASQFNQQNLLDQRQAYEQKQRTNPLAVRQMELENEGRGFNNEATRLGNVKTTRQNEIDAGIPVEAERAARLSDFAKKMSDNDMSQLKNTIEKGLLSLDPNVRKQAQQQRLMYGDLVAERDKLKTQHGYEMAKIGAQGKNQKDVMQMQIDAGRFNRPGKGGSAAKSLEDLFPTIKDPIQRDGVLRMLIQKARLNKNVEEETFWTELQQANAVTAGYAGDIKTAGQAGKVNPAATTGLPEVPRPQLPPVNGTQSPTPAAVPQVGEVRKGYRFKGGNPGDKTNWEKVN